ncbi:MAG TPA: GNAT family N-acetyltransferase [Acidobacteriaceae bacterium]|jgi:GNAT superfamily N-acetyltransferase|nr:GNAT family N-acetyltransferase [Acidobacteriaceae bacterium]
MPALETAATLIRPLSPEDAPAAAELSAQLGYPASPADLRPRIEALVATTDHIVLAAVLNGRLVGWIDAAIERHLQDPDTVNIGGLVVDDAARGSGIGKRLCEAIEDWARSLSIPTVRVRSQIKRTDAHRFYLRDGYRLVKTSLVLEKSVHEPTARHP